MIEKHKDKTGTDADRDPEELSNPISVRRSVRQKKAFAAVKSEPKSAGESPEGSEDEEQERKNKRKKSVKCLNCKKRFVSRYSHKQHMIRMHHDEEMTDEEQEREEMTDEEQERKDKRKKSVKCLNCKNCFVSRYSLKQHMIKVHHVEGWTFSVKNKRKKSVKCLNCKKGFVSRYSLQQHMIWVHHVEGWIFSAANVLKVGENVDLGKKVMKNGTKDTTVKKSVKCLNCKKRFINRYSLKQHMIKVHDVFGWIFSAANVLKVGEKVDLGKKGQNPSEYEDRTDSEDSYSEMTDEEQERKKKRKRKVMKNGTKDTTVNVLNILENVDLWKN